jgi:hypothetical protein
MTAMLKIAPVTVSYDRVPKTAVLVTPVVYAVRHFKVAASSSKKERQVNDPLNVLEFKRVIQPAWGRSFAPLTTSERAKHTVIAICEVVGTVLFFGYPLAYIDKRVSNWKYRKQMDIVDF